MNDQAFRILGIEPTTDGRAIRAAFVRLARIYHPDRFAGMPDDVRAEAERRMKEATVAYESLRGSRTAMRSDPPTAGLQDLRERARRHRETIEARRAEEKQNRARWRRWQEIELQARARAAVESDIAAAISLDIDGPPEPIRSARNEPGAEPAGNGRDAVRSVLAQRLDEARRSETAALVPQRERTV